MSSERMSRMLGRAGVAADAGTSRPKPRLRKKHARVIKWKGLPARRTCAKDDSGKRALKPRASLATVSAMLPRCLIHALRRVPFVLFVSSVSFGPFVARAADRPNILFLIADDLG